MFELDLRSRDPIYQQLVDKFKSLIIKNVLQPDEQLPSVRTLAQQLTVNPNTIQKAYRELEAQGYIYSVKGKGSFVSPTNEQDNHEAIQLLKTEIKKLLLEAAFLGVTEEELFELVKEAIKQAEGGKTE
ncbi:GntR family transcriptional regulator [Amphibacillus xylanus]|uniref:Putative GntR family transcriptional regulator n=1 Tax=Amphibacillus xylanus (strain ATCC 51415 / DSM 6626 / JCM 7361 / LMG 17667 / NBRC 15112 / Ep01) TaxID=698758 RepID=K0IZ79_AMPXN|nr:GntR family transcriptional regulator [Amphibacillus xylanus]BAM47789.1 putative GntR family transcriptional regulator [Amphibacillus xylanus NBRC 15112]